MSTPLEDYALIGDGCCAALVSKAGSIDWWCVPRFDSPACFAALLGTPDNGYWLIAPKGEVHSQTRQYRGETLVLETVFETADGSVALIDCMPLPSDSDAPQLVRLVEGRTGRVAMRMELVIRFDYGSIVPWVTRQPGSLRAIAGPDTLHLHTEVPWHGENLRTVAEFEVSAGSRVPFVITYHPSHLPERAPVAGSYAVERTEAAWSDWSKRSRYTGAHREAVQRSLIVLKALIYEPTGGTVAAPTTSLPEQLGGSRNWDYRFCWLRDATITLYSLLLAGTPSQVQVIYGLRGERHLTEVELPWLPGYESSSPVRIGNAAHSQLQLDVFGELMDAMHQCRRAGIDSEDSWALERNLLEFLEANWQRPDASIWEVRGPLRHFTYSKVMAWVAFDRAIKAVEMFGRAGPVERWRATRARIHAEVCARAYSEEQGAFVQSYDTTELDASLLQMPLVGFLPPDDPRIRGTVRAIERELLIDDTFVLRYHSQRSVDGLPAGEGAFLACSFWLVSNRVMQGRRREAEELFTRLLGLRNDVGLLAEEYDIGRKRQVGNFPQAFSHLALVDAAQALSEPAKDPASHRLTPERYSRAARGRGGKQV
jgi:GH15 family glucan-1,4-alpha-glucosidase